MFQSKKKDKQEEPDISTVAGFEELYNRHVVVLCKIIYRQTKDYSTAESIIQNVFVSLWEKRSMLKIKGSIENYLVGAVKLAVLNHNRKEGIRRDRLEEHLADYCGTTHCTEHKLNYEELNTKINRLVDQLPCQCKNVYELSRIKGLSNKEIASTLLISENTVENHLSKALKFLRKNLKEYQSLSSILLLLLTS
ncbi:MAG: RNA polymerase sigma-70 factor [Bacteroidota bacterium]